MLSFVANVSKSAICKHLLHLSSLCFCFYGKEVKSPLSTFDYDIDIKRLGMIEPRVLVPCPSVPLPDVSRRSRTNAQGARAFRPFVADRSARFTETSQWLFYPACFNEELKKNGFACSYLCARCVCG